MSAVTSKQVVSLKTKYLDLNSCIYNGVLKLFFFAYLISNVYDTIFINSFVRMF